MRAAHDEQAPPPGTCWREWLRWGRHRLGDSLEADLLAARALDRPRHWLIAHGDEIPTPEQADRFRQWVARRAAGEPVAYLLGEREFHGLRFEVGPGVLIPRPETELLVDWALDLALPDNARVADIGTGSGCIVLTLAHERPGWHCTGVDVSEEALELARRNRAQLGLERVELLRGDLLEPLAPHAYDLIVSNPPYVAADDPHLLEGDLRHEPVIALTPGPDGLALLDALIAGAGARLRPGGWLGVEHGWNQGPAVRALYQRSGFEQIATLRDLAGHERVTVGRR